MIEWISLAGWVVAGYLLSELLYLRRCRDRWRDAAVWIANLWASGVQDPRVSLYLLRHACRAAQSPKPQSKRRSPRR